MYLEHWLSALLRLHLHSQLPSMNWARRWECVWRFLPTLWTDVQRVWCFSPALWCMSHRTLICLLFAAGLRMLDLTHNSLTSLPPELGELQHLETLYLRHNKLTHLPVLRNCRGLKELHVGNNQIMGLTPEHLQHLTQITMLDLRDNKIAVLSEEIVMLEKLERLDVTNNDLTMWVHAYSLIGP